MGRAASYVAYGLCGLILIFYFVYWGPIMKRWSGTGMKRVLVLIGFILAIDLFILAPGIAPKIVTSLFIFSLLLITANLPVIVAKGIPDNRRKISSGKNIWEKILIVLWY